MDWLPPAISGAFLVISTAVTVWASRTTAKRATLAQQDSTVLDSWREFAHHITARVAHLEESLETERGRRITLSDHVDVLEAHIWDGKPPPPPPRPAL